MNEKIHYLLDRMKVLEEEMEAALREQEEKVRYSIDGSRVRFERQVRDAHRDMKIKWRQWFVESHPQNIISVPFIYGMLIPLLAMDIALFIYQQVCFRLYKISLVRRSDYVVIDRHRLSYLNAFEKLNCIYCGYGNGLLAYACEIASRTEQYWCPIKHARKAKGSYPRHTNFAAYGAGEEFHQKITEYRRQLIEIDDKASVQESPDKP
ncbi:MAG: hypothetical protein JKX97_00435 [Candidatus Lindowbacteria bacterium]|nr:hypothetical protein [Candidatus Lindowbacteria bacterium]